MSRGFSFSGSYVLSKSMTNQPEVTTGLISSIPNPFDLDALWGPSILDRRHVVAASWVFTPQRKFEGPFLNAVLSGWTLTGLHRYQSGSPLVFIMGTDVAQNGILQPNGQYAQLVPGATAVDVRRDHQNRDDMIAMYFDTAAFVPVSRVPRGIYGNAGRDLATGPSFMNTDFAVLRTFNLRSERLRLQLRAEFFNAFNQVNFNNPNTNLSSGSSFGRITSASDGRVIQLGVKLIW